MWPAAPSRAARRKSPGTDELPFLLQFGQVDIEFVYHYRRVSDGKRVLSLDDHRAFCDTRSRATALSLPAWPPQRAGCASSSSRCFCRRCRMRTGSRAMSMPISRNGRRPSRLRNCRPVSANGNRGSATNAPISTPTITTGCGRHAGGTACGLSMPSRRSSARTVCTIRAMSLRKPTAPRTIPTHARPLAPSPG